MTEIELALNKYRRNEGGKRAEGTRKKGMEL
jgi:hypothetical protein